MVGTYFSRGGITDETLGRCHFFLRERVFFLWNFDVFLSGRRKTGSIKYYLQLAMGDVS